MCDKCHDTGLRPITEEERDAADMDGYGDDTMVIDECYCECEAGKHKHDEFWQKWGPIIDKAVNEM